MNNAVLTT